MMDDNTIFEWMIHIMEVGVVIGIAAVVFYLKKNQKRENRQREMSDEG